MGGLWRRLYILRRSLKITLALGEALRIIKLPCRARVRVSRSKAQARLSMVLSLKLGHRGLLHAGEHVLHALARAPAIYESLARPEHHRPRGCGILLISSQILGGGLAYHLHFACAQRGLDLRGR